MKTSLTLLLLLFSFEFAAAQHGYGTVDIDFDEPNTGDSLITIVGDSNNSWQIDFPNER